jgi:hypothetical protein
LVVRPEIGGDHVITEDDAIGFTKWVMFHVQPDYWTESISIDSIERAPEHDYIYDRRFEDD